MVSDAGDDRRGSSLRRRLTHLLLLAGLAAVMLPTVAAAQTQACDTPAREEGPWLRIAAPAFPEGPQELVAYTVSAIQPDLLLTTNGVVIPISLWSPASPSMGQ